MMEGFEDRLNTLLSSPDAMAKIRKLATSLSEESQGVSSAEAAKEESPSNGLNPEIMRLISSIFGEMQAFEGGKTAALRSLEPLLSLERQHKLEHALEITKLTHAAKTALRKMRGGESNL